MNKTKNIKKRNVKYKKRKSKKKSLTEIREKITKRIKGGGEVTNNNDKNEIDALINTTMVSLMNAPNKMYVIAYLQSIFGELKRKLYEVARRILSEKERDSNYKGELEFTLNYPAFVCVNLANSTEFKIDPNPPYQRGQDYRLTESHLIYKQIEKIDGLAYPGSILKSYNLSNLTKTQEAANDLLLTCKDDVNYVPMMPNYLFSDNYYYCTNTPSFIYIQKPDDLKGINMERNIYTLGPDEIIRIFRNTLDKHSMGTCGQPVICAGHITIKNNKITYIDDHSGHYRPQLPSLLQLNDFLFKKGFVRNAHLNIEKSFFTYF